MSKIRIFRPSIRPQLFCIYLFFLFLFDAVEGALYKCQIILYFSYLRVSLFCRGGSSQPTISLRVVLRKAIWVRTTARPSGSAHAVAGDTARETRGLHDPTMRW